MQFINYFSQVRCNTLIVYIYNIGVFLGMHKTENGEYNIFDEDENVPNYFGFREVFKFVVILGFVYLAVKSAKNHN